MNSKVLFNVLIALDAGDDFPRVDVLDAGEDISRLDVLDAGENIL